MKHDPVLVVNLKKAKTGVVQSENSLIAIAGRGEGETFENCVVVTGVAETGVESQVNILDTKSPSNSRAAKGFIISFCYSL